MTREDLIDLGYEDAILFEHPSFDECIVGVSTDGRVIYSLSKMVTWYSEKEKVTAEDAWDFIEFKSLGALPYVENGPIVMDDL